MYCPNCGTNNLEGARYCRSCGVDISLVPQAMTGRMPEHESVAIKDEGRRGGHRRKGEPSLDKAIKNIFTGIAFLIVTIVLAFTPMGRAWWFWMFIPTFATLGGGIAEWVRLKQSETRAIQPPRASMQGAIIPPQPRAGEFARSNAAAELPRRSTAELIMQPPSVTEGTTRHLSDEAPTRHIGRNVENPSSENRADS